MTVPKKLPPLALLAVFLLLAQVLLLSSGFPLSGIGAGASSWHIDGPYHVYQVELGRALLKQGALTGLDPYFGAGYLGGVTYNVSARLPVLAGGLLPDAVPSGLVYAVYVLACALLAPLAILLMARRLRWPLPHTAFAALAGLAFWWIGALHWYHTAGMASFVCAAYFATAYGAWVWALCTPATSGSSMAGVLMAGLAGGAGMWFHPLFGVLVAPWFLALAIANRKDIVWRPLCVNALLIGTITLALNTPWILAMMASPNIANQQPYQKTVGLAVALKPLLGIWSGGAMGSFLNPLCLLVCIAAMLRFGRGLALRIFPLLAAAAMLLLFAAFGAANAKLAVLQPNRFIAPAFLLIGLAAAYCVGEYAVSLSRSGRRAPRLAATMAALLFAAYLGREMVREATPGPHGHYGPASAELTATPAAVGELESWIRAHTTADGRILFETSLARVHGGGHSAGMIALATGRELVGAAYPFSLPGLSFWDNAALGAPIGELTEERLLQYLDHYNVGWIVAHSPGLIAAADRLAIGRRVARFGPIQVFEVRRPLSFLLSGSGRVVARGFNRIEIGGAGGPELTLRYHWMPGLSVTPPARLEPVPSPVAGWPPLIRVLSPPEHFVISGG